MEKVTVTLSDRWRASYPEAVGGILSMRNVSNPATHPSLEARKREAESQLRARLLPGGAEGLKSLPQIQAYQSFYRRFGKSYHVLLQLESVALREKPIPSVAALVEAMFLAELETQLLTAGHDLAAVRLPVTLDVASGDERYVKLNGEEQKLKAGDLMMTDREGVIASVIYGPDQRTRITSTTQEVLYVTYAPPGIDKLDVTGELESIRANVLLVAPDAETELLRVYGAGD